LFFFANLFIYLGKKLQLDVKIIDVKDSTTTTNLMRSYGGLLEPRGSKLALLKSTFNAENFICRLSWLISSDFDTFTLEMCVADSNCEKKSLKTPILGFKVIDVGTTGKLVSSACYDTQQVCVYLRPFSR